MSYSQLKLLDHIVNFLYDRAQELLPRLEIVDPARPEAPLRRCQVRHLEEPAIMEGKHFQIPPPPLRVMPKPYSSAAFAPSQPRMRKRVV